MPKLASTATQREAIAEQQHNLRMRGSRARGYGTLGRMRWRARPCGSEVSCPGPSAVLEAVPSV